VQTFHAAAVSAEELHDLNTYVAVLAEEPDGEGMRLEIQRAFSFDGQDRALGMDTYCLCTETGACHYGGVTRWVIHESSVEILLDARASSVLDVDGGFRVEVPAKYLPTLQEALPRLLGPSL
jgi:hypothetical protein